MNLTVIFTAILVLAIFIVPFYWVAHSKKHTTDQPDHRHTGKEPSQVSFDRMHGKKH